MPADRFNLSALALRHRSVTLFFLVVLLLAGTQSLFRLGRAEDPDFTVKTMVISAQWPGATAREIELQVTDRIERKLQELPFYDHATSYSKPGEMVVKLNLRQDTPSRQVAELWYQARKKIGDIRGTLPEGVQGPFFNDEFGDTYGVIYAFSGESYRPLELKRVVEDVRQRLLGVRDVGKIELIGAQEERIFVELSHGKLATLGLDVPQIASVLRRHNLMSPAGLVETPGARIALRLDGWLESVEAVRDLPLQAGGRMLRLADVADVTRGPEDPKGFVMRFNGRNVIGLAISMNREGDILETGRVLADEMSRVRAGLPAGIEVEQVTDQPQIVKRSIDEFLKTLGEALIIVLAVTFLSLGLRTGIVVALSVPLVLAITFLAMDIAGINLQRISLGALIIALGLLVDDAIIVVEMMMVKLEQGWERGNAAAFAYASTAFPMLTGTLVTAIGFVPVGFAKSTAGEYTNSIFWVVGFALLISWVVAVVFTPFLGHALLPTPKPHAVATPSKGVHRSLRRAVTLCVRWRKTSIAVTSAAFLAAVAGFALVPQQFFPSANRPELIVDLRLAEGSSFAATEAAARRVEAMLREDADVVSVATYVGGGTPRFYLPLNPELRSANFAQLVLVAQDNPAREKIFARLRTVFDQDYPELRARVARLENGPPVGYPVQFRVVGSDPQIIREIAAELREVMRANPHTHDVNLEWNELATSVRLELDRPRIRQLGLDPQEISGALSTLLSGMRVTQLREGKDLIDVVVRAVPEERLALGAIADINIVTSSGRAVPLGQIVRSSVALEEAVLWRRNRETMLAVRADIRDATQAPVVSAEIEQALAGMRARLPAGYRIDTGGAVEESVKSQRSIAAVLPVMGLLMLAVLMVQLRSFQRVALVFLTAPLGIIGVTIALLASGLPFGFVAMLGLIALAGMIMRNAVILVAQIEQDIASGQPAEAAIIDATVRRARPIVLTALAAILAMIPLAQSNFWAPMAVAIMGGLAVATLLTLLFLPALYAAWFRVVPASATGPLPLAEDRLRLAIAAE